MEGAGPAASAGIMGMKCRGFAPWLFPGDAFPVLDASPKYLIRSVPCSFRFLAEIPGMALPARKIASRLINGEIILGAGEMNGRDHPFQAVFLFSKGGLAG
jgi:hypothetical protein